MVCSVSWLTGCGESKPQEKKAETPAAGSIQESGSIAGKVSFSEVVLAQQTLATTYTGYLSVLASAWQAVADLSRLAQSEEPIGAANVSDSWPDPVTPVRRRP